MKKQLLYRLTLLILVIFLLNLLALQFSWYYILWWFDMPMHFLGGLWLALAGVWFYYFRFFPSTEKKLTVSRIILISLLSSVAIGLLWEGFEFLLNVLIPSSTPWRHTDSLSDMFFDTAGGVVATLYLMLHLSSKKGE